MDMIYMKVIWCDTFGSGVVGYLASVHHDTLATLPPKPPYRFTALCIASLLQHSRLRLFLATPYTHIIIYQDTSLYISIIDIHISTVLSQL